VSWHGSGRCSAVPDLREVHPEAVRPRQGADVLQAGGAEHPDDPVGTAAEHHVLADRQAAGRRLATTTTQPQ